VIDLHCHLLPGVDDGPSTMEESVAYARLAADHGTTTIVATPHVELVTVSELPDRVREVQRRLDDEGIPIHVEVGGELKHGSVAGLSQDDLETIAHGPSGARWLLLEVPFAGIEDDFHAAAAELRLRGFTPVLAHPERSSAFAEEGLPGLREEIDRGCAVAMNTGPLAARESVERGEAATAVLKAGMPVAIATDAHPPSRPWTLRMARHAILTKTGDRALATQLTETGPATLLKAGVRPAAAAAPGA
jgi:protein-tyrosine phosphatase